MLKTHIDIETAIEFIIKNYKNKGCVLCGCKDWAIDPTDMGLFSYGLIIKDKGRYASVIMATCLECAYVMLFSVEALNTLIAKELQDG